MIRLIALKELRSLLQAHYIWYILGALQLIVSLFYLGRMNDFIKAQAKLAMIANAPGATEAIVPYTFNVAALLLLLLTPVFTMRALADEQRAHTLPLLLSAPVSSTHIVLGKFAGLLAFLWLIVLGCTATTLTLRIGTAMDIGLLLGNTLGLMLLTASYTALGLYASSLTAQPIAAAVGALVTLAGLLFTERSASAHFGFWHALTPTGHFHNLNSGLLDSGDVVYYLLFTGFFLTLAIRRLRTARAYG